MTTPFADELMVESLALQADQALCESEAAHGRRLRRSEAERVIEQELAPLTRGRSRAYTLCMVDALTRLLLDERGYTSGLLRDRQERVFPDGATEARRSFWRVIAARAARSWA
jgi:hypothetical protein